MLAIMPERRKLQVNVSDRVYRALQIHSARTSLDIAELIDQLVADNEDYQIDLNLADQAMASGHATKIRRRKSTKEE